MVHVARLTALCVACTAALAPAAPPPPTSCRSAAGPFFARAWDAWSNVRSDEARELFAQTVAVDPQCTLAWAYLGSLTPGTWGRKLVDDAVAASSGLPEAERLTVLSLAAEHRGDHEQALSLARSAVVWAPGVAAHELAVAQHAAHLELWKEVAEAARRATALAPDLGPAWNLLGYAAIGLDDHGLAIEAFRAYAEVAPTEPNAHDSLGDALLADGQLDAAEDAFKRAVRVSDGAFWPSHHGVATVCAVRGDWFCARAELEKARRAAPRPEDKLALREWTAWSYLAEQQPAEAFRVVAELEQEARRLGLDLGVQRAKLLEGRFLLAQGKPRAALATFTAMGNLRTKGLSEGERQALEADRLHGLGEAFARLGQVAEAEKVVTRLRALFEARPRDVRGNDAVQHLRGLIFLAKDDASGAINAFMRCSEGFDVCRLDLAKAQLAAGDRPAAERSHALTRTLNHRDPVYWWARTQAKLAADQRRAW